LPIVSISVYLLPRAVRCFRARFPAIDLVVVTGTASDTARALVANDPDVGLVSLLLRDRELTVTPSTATSSWPSRRRSRAGGATARSAPPSWPSIRSSCSTAAARCAARSTPGSRGRA
jgi:DNA-binding transcriptional LysR family regulator